MHGRGEGAFFRVIDAEAGRVLVDEYFVEWDELRDLKRTLLVAVTFREIIWF